MLRIKSGPIVTQYLIVVTANMCILCSGLGIAWPSPMLVKLRNSTHESQIGPLTEEEGSWVVSITSLSCAIFILLAGILVDRLGRKYCIILSYLPRLIHGLMLIFAKNFTLLMIARALNGTADAMAFTVIPMYISEIASPKIRGSLVTILQASSCLGIVTVFSMGPFVSYFTMNLFILLVSLMTFPTMFFLPESPYFLYTRGREDAALELLTRLRGSETLSKNEILEYSLVEKINTVDKIKLFTNKVFLKAFTIAFVSGIGIQVSGYNAVTYYLQSILESTGTNVMPAIASVAIGIIQLIASLSTVLTTDKFGRKPILILTLIGMTIGMIGLSIFFWLRLISKEVSGFENYIPLLSLLLIVFCFSSGIGSLMWGVCAELFEGSSRAIGMSTFAILSMFFTFITTRYFPDLIFSIGAPIAYLIFAACCMFLCIFFKCFLPETTGRTFLQIQEEMGAVRVKQVIQA